MMKPKILVTSAAGKTSFAAAMQLLEKGYPVRAFVHRHSHRAELLRNAGAEIFVGNMHDIRDVRKALSGVQRAYYCHPVEPNYLHTSMIFATAANEARLETVTVMTQWFAHSTHPSVMTREHWLTDQIMSWMPNVDVITVNPALFADNYFMVLAMIAQLGIMPLPFGDGASLNAPPSNEDIARVAVGTLIDPTSHVGKSYRPTGPELLSVIDIAGIFSKVLNRKVKYVDIPPKMFLKAGIAQGFPLYQPANLAHYYFEEHQRGALTVNAPNDTVLEIGRRAPEDFETITRRYCAERPEAIQTFSNKLKAMQFFIKMLMTPAPDMESYEQQQNYPLIKKPDYSSDSEEWLAAHDQQDNTSLVSLHPAQHLAGWV
ncbi:MAG: NmrA family NAD(P)-binding protein [Nitrosomonadaceae bacterium]